MSTSVPPTRRWRRRFASNLGVRDIREPQFAHSAMSIDPVDQLEYAASVGFDGASGNFLRARDARTQSRMRSALEQLGLEFSSFCHVAPGERPAPWCRADVDVVRE